MVLKNGQEITHFCKEEIKKARFLSSASGLKEGYWFGKSVGTIEAYETLLELIEDKEENEDNPFIYTPKVTYYWNNKTYEGDES